ncbi:MAG: hypothetical protein BMS9Abin12_1955 [Acidimicrobiia bacterium]|nr:MAG: hypothetical protein BMS9Abin12_1955 [Acidimicrobiia bacterium]
MVRHMASRGVFVFDLEDIIDGVAHGVPRAGNATTSNRPALSDNGIMTKREDTQEPATAQELVSMLDDADPADAPEIAEALAARLTKELSATETNAPHEQGSES